jgi:dihydropteroate synthase
VNLDQRLARLFDGSSPYLMGIVNVTDDSFYDGGYSSHSLTKQINEFNECGVDIIDIGAESSRPGATPITAKEEISRLQDSLAYIQKNSEALLSVDTYKSETAAFCLENGVHIINDISGGESPDMLKVVAKYKAGIVLMHKQGPPKTMQNNPTYDNPILDIKSYLNHQIKQAKNAGIHQIMIDPGIGFGKTLEHNLAILNGINQLLDLNCPILIGTSNKSFIGDITGAQVSERVPGSIASVLATYQKGAHIFRVHNVRETNQALDVFRAIG